MANTNHADPFTSTGDGRVSGSQPLLHQHGEEVQRFGQMRLLPIALSHDAKHAEEQLKLIDLIAERVQPLAEHLVDVPAVRI